MNAEYVVVMDHLVKKKKVVQMKMLVTMMLMQLKMMDLVCSVERDVRIMEMVVKL